MKLAQEAIINQQRAKIAAFKSKVVLFSPCKVKEGISYFTSVEMKQFETNFKLSKINCCFFIPASGSGSRMFEFLYDFLNNPTHENTQDVMFFFENIKLFSFYETLTDNLKNKINQVTITFKTLTRYLLDELENKYSFLPKALFPFHDVNKKILNPFQEHVMQGKMLSDTISFHFTVPMKFENLLISNFNELDSKFRKNIFLSFSEQNPSSDAYVFLKNGNLVIDSNNKPLRRPAGHGSLLVNLQDISSDLIFVKNVDNVQHFSRSQSSNEILMQLGGLTLELKSEISKLILSLSKKEITLFNNRFHLFSDSELNSMDSPESIFDFLNRPLRVCGMVRNGGQVGGGPFFTLKNGLIQKQIVEKTQIDFSGNQATIYSESTHFNPVIMVLDIKNSAGNKFDLATFCDDDQYLVVNKNHLGQDVCYLELPGLWNGQMANWSTLFVEIPRETFSPVKSILDLLNPLHFDLSD